MKKIGLLAIGFLLIFGSTGHADKIGVMVNGTYYFDIGDVLSTASLPTGVTAVSPNGLDVAGTLSAGSVSIGTTNPVTLTPDGASGFGVAGPIAASQFNTPKVNNTADAILFRSSHGTDTTGAGFKGPTSASGMANSYHLILPEAEPAAGQVQVAGAPSSHDSTQVWAYPGASRTPVVGDPDSWTIAAADWYGGTLIANAAGEFSITPAVAGVNFVLKVEGANVVIANPDATGTADTITLNGTALTQGQAIKSDGTAGALVVCQYRSADALSCDSDSHWAGE